MEPISDEMVPCIDRIGQELAKITNNLARISRQLEDTTKDGLFVRQVNYAE